MLQQATYLPCIVFLCRDQLAGFHGRHAGHALLTRLAFEVLLAAAFQLLMSPFCSFAVVHLADNSLSPSAYPSAAHLYDLR